MCPNPKISLLTLSSILIFCAIVNSAYAGTNGCDSAEPFRTELGNHVCMTGNTTGATFGLYDTDSEGCMGSPFETFWFSVPTHMATRYLAIELQSSELEVPTLSIYRGVCGSLEFLDCNVSYSGFLSMRGVLIESGVDYFIAVSSLDGSFGEFQVCYDLEEDTNVCNLNSELDIISTSQGSPHCGPYKQGEEVNVCYRVNGFQNVGCNYLQAIIPLFGEGWDVTSYEVNGEPDLITTPLETQGHTIFTTSNPSCEGDPAGTWTWLNNGELEYNLNSENTLDLSFTDPVPPGWVFINSFDPSCFIFTDACCTNPTNDPNMGYGDDDYPLCGNGMTQTWEVCFTLRASTDPTLDESSCEVGLKTFSDGETGVFTNKDCKLDRVAYINSAVEALQPPIITADNRQAIVCLGDSLSLPLISDVDDVQFFWMDNNTGETIKGSDEPAFTGIWNEAGDYSFTVYATNGSRSNAIQIEVEVTNQVLFTIEQTPATACNDDFVTLRVVLTDEDQADQLNFAWNGGMAGTEDVLRVAASDTSAMVDVILGNCVTSQSISFDLYAKNELTLSAPQNACVGEDITFSANATSNTWNLAVKSNGEVVNISSEEASFSSVIELSQSVDFEVINATDANGCDMTVVGLWQTIIHDPIQVDAGSDINLTCDQNQVDVMATISLENQDYNATWRNIATGEVVSSILPITITEEGDYQLSVINIETGCIESDTVSVTRIERDIDLAIASSDVRVQAGMEIDLEIISNLDQSEIILVEWIHDGSLSCADCMFTTARPTTDVTYTVLVTDDLGCQVQASISITVEDADTNISTNNIYIPNAFSPGSLDQNAIFRIFGDDNIEVINSFRVFDRWGGILRAVDNISPDDESGLWDGRANGDIVNAGIYLYTVDLTMKDGLDLTKTGTITVIR